MDKAVSTPPPERIAWRCGQYYAPYYHLMYLLCEEMAPCQAVELGVHSGRGCMSMLHSDKVDFVVGIDVHRHQLVDHVEQCYPHRFRFLQQSSTPAPELQMRIGLLHFDTAHSYAQVKAELEAYESQLSHDAVLLFDDLHAMEGEVLQFFNELPYPKIQDDRLHPVCGYGVVLYE
jgi:hypothetical protein